MPMLAYLVCKADKQGIGLCIGGEVFQKEFVGHPFGFQV